MAKKLLIVLLGLIVSFRSFSQKEANTWYFGSQAGVQFDSLQAYSVDNSAMISYNGCATISDNNGKLLFYSNGEKVWNKNHVVMSNGYMLAGSPYVTQGCIIVPNPANKNIYYLLTLTEARKDYGGDLFYSVIDMTRNNGLGEVIDKNVFLADSMTEKMSATLHGNKKDYWVVVHQWGTNAFYSYLINDNGINTNPVISHAGTVQFGGSKSCVVSTWCNAMGCMKISPNGTRLALAINGEIPGSNHIVELFRFERFLGTVYDSIHLLSRYSPLSNTKNIKSAYGIEFSPDGSKLYVTSFINDSVSLWELYQYDIDACISTDIRLSEALIARTEYNESLVNLQNGPDGRIYISGTSLLSVINKPNLSGKLCEFEKSSILLSGGSNSSLPNFITSYFKMPPVYFTYTPTCLGDTTYFALADTSRVKNVTWKFYDSTLSGYTISTDLFPKYYYPSPGEYRVSIDIDYSNKCGKFIGMAKVKVNNLAKIFPGDTTICENDTLIIRYPFKDASYIWQDGSTDSHYAITIPDTAIVNITLGACIQKDTIIVDFIPRPNVNLGTDTILCTGDTILLNAYLQDGKYLWNDGSTNSSKIVTQDDTIWVNVTVNNCKNSDSILISFINPPSVNLGNDTVLCKGESLILDATGDLAEIIWYDGSSYPNHIISQKDKIWVNVTNQCGNAVDTIEVDFIDIPNISIPLDTTYCFGDSLTINLPSEYKYYLNKLDIDSTVIINSSGIYTIEAVNKCGRTQKSLSVEYVFCCDPIVPNLITPNRDGLNDSLIISCIEDLGWTLEITNSSGIIIFKDSNYNNNFFPSELQEGIYFYSLFKKGRDSKKGWIHVIK